MLTSRRNKYLDRECQEYPKPANERNCYQHSCTHVKNSSANNPVKKVIAGFTGVSLVDVLLKQDAYQLAKLVAYDCREADPCNNGDLVNG